MIILCDMIDNAEDKLKFERIYETYKNIMYMVALGILKNEHDAEDIVADAMIKVIKILDRISEDEIRTMKCKGLMITITKHLAIDYYRKLKRIPVPMTEIELPGQEQGVEKMYITMENYKEIVECLNSLDDKYKDVLMLKVVHYLASKEIAEILNISEANVNMRFMRAKRELARLMEERNKK